MKKLFSALLLLCIASVYKVSAQTNIVSEGTDSLLFFNAGSQSMTIGEDGRVRIGGVKFLSTTSVLELNSSGQGFLIPRVVSGAAITDPKPGMIAYNTTTDKFISYSAGAGWSIILTSAGNYPTKIEDADGNTRIEVEEYGNNDTISFYTAGTRKMVIDNVGNIGVGTSTPAASIDVLTSTGNGAIRGMATGTNSSNVGVYGDASGGEVNVGMFGKSASTISTDTAYGGLAQVDISGTGSGAGFTGVVNTTGTNGVVGIQGIASGTGSTGTKVGVSGTAKNKDATTSILYGGLFNSSAEGGSNVAGLYSYATQTAAGVSGTFVGGSFGVETNGTGATTMGVFSNSGSGIANYAGYFDANGAGTDNYGIYANAINGTTNNFSGYFDNGNVYIKENLGIGTNAPAGKIHVQGIEIPGNFIDDDFDGFTDEEDAIVLDNVGNVGIGTATPISRIHLSGIEMPGNTIDDDLDGYTDEEDAIVITSAGNIGIGTTIPTQRFHVAGLEIPSNFADDDGDGYIDEEDAIILENSGNIGIGTTLPTSRIHLSAIEIPGNTIDDDIDGFTDEEDVVVITSVGNIGIGTTIPSQRFHVAGLENLNAFDDDGDGYVDEVDAIVLDNSGNVGIGTATPTGRIHLSGIEIPGNFVDDDIDGFTDEEDAIVLDNGGNVGIGTTTPISRIHLSGIEMPGNFIDDDGDGFLDEEDAIVITSAGNVGIGTTNPAVEARLQVSDVEIPSNGIDDDGDGTVDETNHIMMFTNEGYFGLGTTSPMNRFHLMSNEISGNFADDDGDGITDETDDLIYSSIGGFGLGTNSPVGRFSFFGHEIPLNAADDDGDGEVDEEDVLMMNIFGNIGVGTTTPSAKLDVVSDGGSILIPRKSTTGDPTGINGMMYYNTADAKFRVFENGAWADWVTTVGGDFMSDGSVPMTGQFVGASGTAAAPGISFSGDADNGIYSPIINQLGISTAGAERIRIDASGNIGIGTSTPIVKLHVADNTQNGIVSQVSSATLSPFLAMYRSRGTVGSEGAVLSNDIIGNLIYMSHNGTAAGDAAYIKVKATENHGTGRGAEMQFHTTTNTSGSPSQKMVIDNAGNVGVGTATPLNKLDVEGGVVIGATYSGTNTAPTNGLLVEGSIGVGTTSPSHLLHLHKGGTPNPYILFTDATTGSTSTDGLIVGTNGAGSMYIVAQETSFDLGIGTSGNNNLITLETTNSNVGIGAAPNHANNLFEVVTNGSTTKGFVVSGTYNNPSGAVPDLGAGSRMMYFPAKAAFRAGVASGTEWDNANVGFYSFAGGWGNTASGNGAIALGSSNSASASTAVTLGSSNTVTASSGVALGSGNNVSNNSSVALGGNNTVSGNTAFAAGFTNSASGDQSVALGRYCTASGIASVALGNRTSAGGFTGSFLFGDNSTTTNLISNASNQFSVRAAGGVRFFTNAAMSIGVQVAAGGNSWASISDSTKKENFVQADGEAMLQKIHKINRAGSWNYIGQDAKKMRHYGPMAQDIFSAFGNDGVGIVGNDTLIASADMDGILFIAIKALEKRTFELNKAQQSLLLKNNEVDNLKVELESLRKELSENEKRFVDWNNRLLELEKNQKINSVTVSKSLD